ncbi:MAG: hypothetical protein JWM71_870, partial [Solirubrobacteraceae bacterium]|nr:hypothetical protein [Solirubrobacteraceae bacterium]
MTRALVAGALLLGLAAPGPAAACNAGK